MVQPIHVKKAPDNPGVKIIASKFENKAVEQPFQRPIDPILAYKPSIKETVDAVMLAAAAAAQAPPKSPTSSDPVLSSSSRKPVKEAASQVIAAGEMEKNKRVIGPAVIEAAKYASARELPVRVAAAHHEEFIAACKMVPSPIPKRGGPPWSAPERDVVRHSANAVLDHATGSEQPVVTTRAPPKSSPASFGRPVENGLSMGLAEHLDANTIQAESAGSLVEVPPMIADLPNADQGTSPKYFPAELLTDISPTLPELSNVDSTEVQSVTPTDSPEEVCEEEAGLVSPVLSEQRDVAVVQGKGVFLKDGTTEIYQGNAVAEQHSPMSEKPLSVVEKNPNSQLAAEDSYGVIQNTEDFQLQAENSTSRGPVADFFFTGDRLMDMGELIPNIIDLVASALSQPDSDLDEDELFGDGLDILDLNSKNQGRHNGDKAKPVVEHDAFIIEEADVRAAIERAEEARLRSESEYMIQKQESVRSSLFRKGEVYLV